MAANAGNQVPMAAAAVEEVLPPQAVNDAAPPVGVEPVVADARVESEIQMVTPSTRTPASSVTRSEGLDSEEGISHIVGDSPLGLTLDQVLAGMPPSATARGPQRPKPLSTPPTVTTTTTTVPPSAVVEAVPQEKMRVTSVALSSTQNCYANAALAEQAALQQQQHHHVQRFPDSLSMGGLTDTTSITTLNATAATAESAAVEQLIGHLEAPPAFSTTEFDSMAFLTNLSPATTTMSPRRDTLSGDSANPMDLMADTNMMNFFSSEFFAAGGATPPPPMTTETPTAADATTTMATAAAALHHTSRFFPLGACDRMVQWGLANEADQPGVEAEEASPRARRSTVTHMPPPTFTPPSRRGPRAALIEACEYEEPTAAISEETEVEMVVRTTGGVREEAPHCPNDEESERNAAEPTMPPAPPTSMVASKAPSVSGEDAANEPDACNADVCGARVQTNGEEEAVPHVAGALCDGVVAGKDCAPHAVRRGASRVAHSTPTSLTAAAEKRVATRGVNPLSPRANVAVVVGEAAAAEGSAKGLRDHRHAINASGGAAGQPGEKKVSSPESHSSPRDARHAAQTNGNHGGSGTVSGAAETPVSGESVQAASAAAVPQNSVVELIRNARRLMEAPPPATCIAANAVPPPKSVQWIVNRNGVPAGFPPAAPPGVGSGPCAHDAGGDADFAGVASQLLRRTEEAREEAGDLSGGMQRRATALLRELGPHSGLGALFGEGYTSTPAPHILHLLVPMLENLLQDASE